MLQSCAACSISFLSHSLATPTKGEPSQVQKRPLSILPVLLISTPSHCCLHQDWGESLLLVLSVSNLVHPSTAAVCTPDMWNNQGRP